MKQIISILIFALLFIGCATKTRVEVQPYTTLNQNKTQNFKVQLIDVKDKRDSQISAIVKDKTSIKKEYILDTDLTNWYKEAIIRELKNASIYAKNSDIKLYINILKLKSTYKQYSFASDNLTADAKIQIIIKIKDTTIKTTMTLSQANYKTTMLDASGFDDIINSTLKDSVSKIVSTVIAKIKEIKQ